ncbi:MAG: multiple sugar transport system permease protein [Halanaerobiales bacterium]|nr:multiple sugar transport system permease protein [Halanaerobiales bacterium]
MVIKNGSLLKDIYKHKLDYFFILPKFILFIIFIALPVVWAFFIAFQEYGIFETIWVGLTNFRDVLTGDLFWIALWNTFRYTLVVVPSQVIIALILASLINPLNRKAQIFFRGAYYLPTVTSVVVISMIWRWMYNSKGLINYLLSLLNIDAVNWLGSSTWALPAIILMSILTPPGVGVILYLASMGSIPESLYEAARIDGAGPITSWFKITLPLVKPTTLYLAILGTIGSFQVFAQVLLLTDGGPGYATTTLVHLIYNSAFRDFEFGFASAQAIVLFGIVLFFSFIQVKFLSSDVEY